MVDKVYGGIRHESVNHNVPVLLNSGVSLAEAVKVWVDSLNSAMSSARASHEWDWHFRVCAWKKRGV